MKKLNTILNSSSVKLNTGKIILAIHDFLVSSLILWASVYLKDVMGNLHLLSIKPPADHYFPKIWFLSFVLVGIMAGKKLYSKQLIFWDQAREIVESAFYTTVLGAFLIFMAKMWSFPRSILIFYFFILVFILPISRHYFKLLLKFMGILKTRIIILGAGNSGLALAKALTEKKELGFEILGFLDDAKVGQTFEIGKNKYSVLGKIKDFKRIIKQGNIDTAAIAIPSLPKEKLAKLTAMVQKRVLHLFVVPELKGIATMNTQLYKLFEEQLFLLKINNNLNFLRNRAIKRTMDILLSLALFPFLLSLMSIISIAIKLDSKGSVFFIQERIGQNGKPFRCIKFRTMYENSERILQDYLNNNSKAKYEWNKYRKLKEFDPRVTRVGKLLRKLSLDELPQAINVIKGEMSFVGPRPYLPEEKKDMGLYREFILITKPGITGLWQVSGRNKLDFQTRLVLDSWYVLNWSLWLDIEILFKTIKVVFKGEGAY